MAPNVLAAAAQTAYDMQPPASPHGTEYHIKATKNEDLEHVWLEMLITMNVHIPLPNPFLDSPHTNPRLSWFTKQLTLAPCPESKYPPPPPPHTPQTLA